jgi:RNase P subunit RPR2
MIMSNERVKKLRAKNLEIGRKRKEYYVTELEHIAIKDKIKLLRKA